MLFTFSINNINLYSTFSYRLPAQPSGEYCLSFAYHMSGEGIGDLKAVLHINGGGERFVWGMRGDQGNMWHTTRIDFTISRDEKVRACPWELVYYHPPKGQNM